MGQFQMSDSRQRWIFISFLGMIVVLFLVTFYTNTIAKDLIRQNRQDALNRSADYMKASLDADFGKLIALMTQLHVDPDIRNLVKQLPFPNSDSGIREIVHNQLNNRLSTYGSSFRYLEGIFILNEKVLTAHGDDSLAYRNFGSESGTNVQIDTEQMIYFDQANEHRGVIQWVPILKNGLLRRQNDDPATLKGYVGPTFSMVRSYDNIKDRNGNELYLVFDINKKWFREWVRQHDPGHGVTVNVVDANGNIIYSPDENAFGTHLGSPADGWTTIAKKQQESGWSIVVSADLNAFSSTVTTSQWMIAIVLALLLAMAWGMYLILRNYRNTQEKMISDAAKLEEAGDLLSDRNRLLEETTDQLSMKNAQLAFTFEEMKSKNEQLSQLMTMKDQLLSNTSHELRTPLNGIIGITEALIEGVDIEPTPMQKQNLLLLLDCGNRLKYQIDQMLDYARLRSGRFDAQAEPVEVQYCIRNAVEFIAAQAKQKGLSLQILIEPDLPAVMSEPLRLVQMLQHLLSNAVKFTPSGFVRVRAYRDGDMVCIEIADSGVGIEPEKMRKLFQAFEQGNGSIERIYGGTGLGLALVEKLAEIYDATIDLESVLHEGTTAYLRLKMAPRAMTPHWKEGYQGQPVKVLIIDDEPINVHVIMNFLQRMPWEFHTAYSANEALLLMESEGTFDLMLMDLMMPMMNGYQLLERVRKTIPSHQTKIIVLSAKPLKEDEDRAYALGADGFLMKPLSKEALMQMLYQYEFKA